VDELEVLTFPPADEATAAILTKLAGRRQ